MKSSVIVMIYSLWIIISKWPIVYSKCFLEIAFQSILIFVGRFWLLKARFFIKNVVWNEILSSVGDPDLVFSRNYIFSRLEFFMNPYRISKILKFLNLHREKSSKSAFLSKKSGWVTVIRVHKRLRRFLSQGQSM